MAFFQISPKKKTTTTLDMQHLKTGVVAKVVLVDFGGFSGADFSDIFEDFFGDFGGGRRSSRGRNSNNRGSDLRYDLSISLEEAYSGKKQNIQFSTSENAILAREMVLNLDQAQIDVPIVVVMEEFVQIKDFLQFNKLVLNVLEVEKK